MKVLVACEESQRVCIEFRKRGHEAYSCDIIECSGGHPEWHIKQDVSYLLDGDCVFETCNGNQHEIKGKWDLIIAFPPCTDLCVSGARWFEEKRENGNQREAIKFFCKFFSVNCDHVAIENPVNIISGYYINHWFPDLAERYMLPIKPTQTIQPWMFGHGETKKTCLWLKGLTKLTPTNVVEEREQRIWRMPPGEDRAKQRSKTFPGIAKAMAEQWG